ncbi:MAG: UvrD-helicase domain-containing protein [Bacteroidota bacterium]
MEDSTEKPLVIYSASAGSGKTFNLVQHYLELTLKGSSHAKAFQRVIAMTFTNKAAWEMKSRIIQALEWLSYPESIPSKSRSKYTAVRDNALQNTGLAEAQLQSRAKQTLTEILHNYEEFHVLTIDKFSLRLIRTFSRDLDLPEDFEVELNEKELLEHVVDELLSKVGKKGNERITRLTVDYAKANLEEGTKWNFRSKLIDFGKVLTQEEEQPFIEQLLTLNFDPEEYQSIFNHKKKLEHEYEEKRNALYEYFIGLGTTQNDYPNKSKGIFNHFDKLKNRTLDDGSRELSATVEKTISGENVKEHHRVDPELINRFVAFVEFEKKTLATYYFYRQRQKSFFNLALLKHLYAAYQQYKSHHHIIGISEFGHRIAQLLNNESALYIYERLGTRFHHFLLDEFQDTSRLQWMNLIPLLHESISNNRKNLIVGDPKQAIYRFRNGLVEQFVALPEIYNPEQNRQLKSVSEHFRALGQKKALQDNYRSKREIVAFNNVFFEEALLHLPDIFHTYYNSIRQNPKGDGGGYVELFSWNKKEYDKSVRDEFVLAKIRDCIRDGYAPGDICVLVRTKKLASHLAHFLISCPEAFKVISSDSLEVGADRTVKVMIDYFRLRRNQSNKTAQMKFASSYFQMKGSDPVAEMAPFWIDGKVGRFDYDRFVHTYFQDETEFLVNYENMYDLGKKFANLLRVNLLKNPYLHHFMEVLHDYDLKNGPDLRSFLEHWDSKAKKENIQLPENDEAIKIMTLHASKGLEFPVVLIPELEWKLQTDKKEEFFEVDESVIRVKLSRKGVPEYVENAYQEEYQQQLLDALNIMYVGFTRAEERLYVMFEEQFPSKNSDHISSINQLVTLIAKKINHPEIIKDENKITIGEPQQVDRKPDQNSGFEPDNLDDFLWFPEISLREDELEAVEVISEEQEFGNQLHLLLASTQKASLLEERANELVRQDKLQAKLKTRLLNTARNVFEIPEFKAIQERAVKSLDEQDLLVNETTTKRPDKIVFTADEMIVIDFKTGQEQQKHVDQVRQYCAVLTEISNGSVGGYLLYTNNMQMKRVI